MKTKLDPFSGELTVVPDKTDIGLSNVPNVDCTNASNITSGVLPLAQVPPAALERLYKYTGAQLIPELMGLTTTDVQNGDTIQIYNVANANHLKMWLVGDDTALSTASSFVEYVAGTTGLTNWIESNASYSSKFSVILTPSSAETNVNVVIKPKGTGGFAMQEADGTTVGGNTRGSYSVDFGMSRGSATNVASGTAAINFSTSGTASGNYSVNCGTNGSATSASAFNGATFGLASGTASVNFGYSGTASGSYSFNSGFGCLATLFGENTHGSGFFTDIGDAQRRELVLRANTTSATPVNLTSDSSAIGAANQLILKNNQSITAQVLVVAKKSGTTSSTAHFKLTVCASRGTTAASTVLHIAPVVETLWNPDGVVIATTVDTTNGAITFTVTTPAGNWHTVADVFAISTIFA